MTHILRVGGGLGFECVAEVHSDFSTTPSRFEAIRKLRHQQQAAVSFTEHVLDSRHRIELVTFTRIGNAKSKLTMFITNCDLYASTLAVLTAVFQRVQNSLSETEQGGELNLPFQAGHPCIQQGRPVGLQLINA